MTIFQTIIAIRTFLKIFLNYKRWFYSEDLNLYFNDGLDNEKNSNISDMIYSIFHKKRKMTSLPLKYISKLKLCFL